MKKRKVNIKYFLCVLIFITGIILINKDNILNCIQNFKGLVGDSKYDIVKLDKNKNYSGEGKKYVDGYDGYFETFTTGKENLKIYREYKQNGDASWKNNKYWGGTMEENGCGITSMSIILSGYGKHYTPEALRKMYSPVLRAEDISSELRDSFGLKNSDFYYDVVHLSKKSIINHLKSNRPILICVWADKGENRWTTTSHYMVLLATDGDMIYVSNPNGLKNNEKSSGWYKSSEIIPYLAKALYIENY